MSQASKGAAMRRMTEDQARPAGGCDAGPSLVDSWECDLTDPTPERMRICASECTP